MLFGHRAWEVRARALLAGALAAAAAGCASPGEGPDRTALPFFERERPVTGAPREWDLAWPFGHGTSGPGRTTAGLRPLWRTVHTDRRDRLEILYPIFRTETDVEDATFDRVFPVLWRDSMPQADGVDTDTSIMPFLFWGNEPGWGPYFLLFPVGGTVTQRFLSDRTTYRRGVLRKSWQSFKTSPFFRRELWESLREYDRKGFHPDDRDTTALVDEWRERLFGDEGELNGQLVGTAA